MRQLQGMDRRLTKLPSGLLFALRDAATCAGTEPAARKALLLFTARRTCSSRRNAARTLAKATGTSVNDVVMTVIDDAPRLHFRQTPGSSPTLLAFAPMV